MNTTTQQPALIEQPTCQKLRASKIWKGREGFEAESVFALDQATHRVLIVTTCKNTGGMISRFCVQIAKGDGIRTWDIFGDYNERIVFKGTRCTEKTVRELHAQALSVVDHHLTQAAAHYATKTADRTACV